MSLLEELQASLKAASIFRSTPEATHRLRDLLVEEVSLVDRAANKRKFLVVKNDAPKPAPNGGDRSQKQGDLDGAAGNVDALVLPSEVKVGLMAILTEAMERLVHVSEVVRSAEETSEPIAEPTPPAMLAEITRVRDLMVEVETRYPSPVAKREEEMQEELRKIQAAIASLTEGGGEVDKAKLASLFKQMDELRARTGTPPKDATATSKVASTLSEIATVAAQLAEQTKGQEKIEGDVADAVKRLKASLDGLLGKVEQSAKQGPDGTPSMLGTEVADKLKVLAAAMAQIAEAPSPMELMALSEKMLGVAKSLGAPEPNPAPSAPPAAETEVEKARKMTARRLKELDTLIERMTQLRAELGAEPDENVTKAIGLLQEGKVEEAVKMLRESQPQRPPEARGVGTHAPGDAPNGTRTEQEGGELAALMKRLDSLDAKVETITKTPQPPASRVETPAPPPGGGGANGTRRERRGGPWIL